MSSEVAWSTGSAWTRVADTCLRRAGVPLPSRTWRTGRTRYDGCSTRPTRPASYAGSRPTACPSTSASCSTATGAGRGRSAPTPRTATAPAPPTSSRSSAGARRSGVEVVTLWLLSTDNLNRPVRRARRPLLAIIDDAVETLAEPAPLAAAPGRRARPAARADRPSGSRRPPRRTARRRRDAGQRRRRLRRPARDRRRRTLAAAGARRAAAPRSRSSPRPSTSSTSPSTSTPRASPTPTW